ncbi:MAG: DUF2834 domain-containing protein [Deltaproteobacteria bacterium]|nr:DUF2834 domain-containing protein [Deltaproteobacteria bacterium]
MKPLTIFLSILLISFVALSTWLVGTNYTGVFAVAGDRGWGTQIFIDLVIACSIGVGWMLRDAKARGIAAIPYVIATAAFGSMGLLAYLIHRGLAAPRTAARPIGAPSVA